MGQRGYKSKVLALHGVNLDLIPDTAYAVLSNAQEWSLSTMPGLGPEHSWVWPPNQKKYLKKCKKMLMAHYQVNEAQAQESDFCLCVGRWEASALLGAFPNPAKIHINIGRDRPTGWARALHAGGPSSIPQPGARNMVHRTNPSRNEQ